MFSNLRISFSSVGLSIGGLLLDRLLASLSNRFRQVFDCFYSLALISGHTGSKTAADLLTHFVTEYPRRRVNAKEPFSAINGTVYNAGDRLNDVGYHATNAVNHSLNDLLTNGEHLAREAA